MKFKFYVLAILLFFSGAIPELAMAKAHKHDKIKKHKQAHHAHSKSAHAKSSRRVASQSKQLKKSHKNSQSKNTISPEDYLRDVKSDSLETGGRKSGSQTWEDEPLAAAPVTEAKLPKIDGDARTRRYSTIHSGFSTAFPDIERKSQLDDFIETDSSTAEN